MTKQEYAQELRQQMAQDQQQKQNKNINRNPPAFNPEATDGFGSNQDKRKIQNQKQLYAQQLREQMSQDQQKGQPLQMRAQAQPQAPPQSQQSNASYEEQERLAKVRHCEITIFTLVICLR